MNNPSVYFKYFGDYKFKSLLFRNFILISSLVIVPFMILIVIFISGLFNTFYSHTTELSINQLEKIQQLTDTKFSEINQISSKLSLDDTIYNFLLFKNENYDAEAINKLKYISLTFDYIDSIYIYSNVTEHYLSINDSVFDKQEIKRLYKSISNEKYIYVINKNENYYTDYITFIKPIYITNTSPSGAIFINISIYHIEKLMNSKNSLNYTYIVDNNNKILCGSHEQFDDMLNKALTELSPGGIYQQFSLKGKSYIACTADSTIPNSRYVSISQVDSLLPENQMTLILICILAVILDILISLLITIQTYTPIYHILDVLNQNYSPIIKKKTLFIKNQNELSYIIDSLKQLQSDKMKITNDLASTIDELNNMHYMLMNSQINAHFLSNTLQAINWIAYELTNSPNDVTDSLSCLSDLYRNLSETDSFIISLSEELEYTEKYLKIMSAKYGKVFTVEYDIEPDTLDTKIPKLCLQPILENAFAHGFNFDSTHNEIKISAHTLKDKVEIVISDNGMGMSEENIKNIFNNHDTQKKTSKIGIANTHKRFKLMFGEEYGLTIKSELYEGTSIHLLLPKNNS